MGHNTYLPIFCILSWSSVFILPGRDKEDEAVVTLDPLGYSLGLEVFRIDLLTRSRETAAYSGQTGH